jgi:hypothetical protein
VFLAFWRNFNINATAQRHPIARNFPITRNGSIVHLPTAANEPKRRRGREVKIFLRLAKLQAIEPLLKIFGPLFLRIFSKHAQTQKNHAPATLP